MKYLTRITPQILISVSFKWWGRHASDELVIQNSGILRHLLPDDLVLADGSFDIRDYVRLMCAALKIPASTRGHSQLDATGVEETRNLLTSGSIEKHTPVLL